MSGKVILCPISGGKSDAPALALGFAAARTLGGRVVALFVRPDVTATIPFMGPGISASLLDEITRAAKDAADEAFAGATRTLKDEATRANVAIGTGVTLVEAEGFPPDQIASTSRLADFVAFARAPDTVPSGDHTSLEETLLRAHRPVLLAPPYHVKTVGTKVAILWDGSNTAAVAVVAALPFLKTASAVTIVHGRTDLGSDKTIRELEESLTLRGIQSTRHVVEAGRKADGPLLAEVVQRIDADLVVMGGYGHGRFREIILGGVTRYMIAHAGIPILLAH